MTPGVILATRKRDDVPNDPAAIPRGVVLFVDGHHADHVDALRVAGYRVEVAPTALAALRSGRALQPDALIVPLELPDMEGGALADRIGAGPRGHALAVVILVPEGDPPRVAEPTAANAVFCHMPCPPEHLVEMVARQLAARRPVGGPPS